MFESCTNCTSRHVEDGASDEDGAGAAGQASQSDVISSKAINLSRREAENVKQNGLCQPFTEYEPSKVNLESDFAFNALS